MGWTDTVARSMRTLAGRMTLGMLATHLMLVPLLFASVLYLVKQDLQEQFIDFIRTDAYNFSILLAYESQPMRLKMVLENAFMDGRFVVASVHGNEGQEVARAGDAQTKHIFQEDFFFGQHDDAVYSIVLPVVEDAAGGNMNLRISFDETPTRERIAEVYRRVAFLVIAYLIITLAVVVFIAIQWTGALQRLRKLSRRVTAGEFQKQLRMENTFPELTDLTHDLNQMRHKLVTEARDMEYKAMHDGLTGLPNRMLFNARLEHALQYARREGRHIAVLFMDLDRFKNINDTLGHSVGDQLLQQAAERLVRCVREVDTVARQGGDEFTVVLESLDNPQHAEMVAQEILETMEEPFELGGRDVCVSVSIGGSIYPQDGQDAATLLKHADAAMYTAKSQGRKRYKFYQRDDRNGSRAPDSRDKHASLT